MFLNQACQLGDKDLGGGLLGCESHPSTSRVHLFLNSHIADIKKKNPKVFACHSGEKIFKAEYVSSMHVKCQLGKNYTNVEIYVISYLVGSTRGVESICSANKQGVIILLQEDFDEIMTLILHGVQDRKGKKDKEKRPSQHLCQYTFTLIAPCGL